jgi:membrane-associated phospholipid phosphatase
MPPPSPISSIYRFWFLILDPILTITGIYCNFLAPDFILAGINPAHRPPTSSETILLLDTGGGWFIAVLILQLGLLRARPNDVLVWWYFAAAIGAVDVVICAGILRALRTQGRLEPEAWRMEDRGNLGITAACALVRGAFVLGIGISEVDDENGKKM